MPQNTDSAIYIVTGATGSIGTEIARALVTQGKAVMLACRNMRKADALKKELEASGCGGEILTGELMLDSLAGIRSFADYVKSLRRQVAALINNAGVMCRYRSVTADGFEQTLAVNYLGTVLLTELLLPAVVDCGSVTFTTSITRKIHSLREPILDEPTRKFAQLGTYGRSKLALTHYALYLSQRSDVAQRGIRVNCADPGVVNTSMITMQRWYDPLANVFFRPFISTPAQGASSALSAMSSDASGQIFKHRHTPHPIAADLRKSDAALRHDFVAATRKLLNLLP